MTEQQKFAALLARAHQARSLLAVLAGGGRGGLGRAGGPAAAGLPLLPALGQSAAFYRLFRTGAAGDAGLGARIRARVILGAVLLLGGVLEILQAYVGRDAQWADMFANTLGAIVGLGLGFLLLRAAQAC